MHTYVVQHENDFLRLFSDCKLVDKLNDWQMPYNIHK